MSLSLTPYAFVTVARLEQHLSRVSVNESDITDRCTAAINAATAWMEWRTKRALAARNWRTAFATQITTTSADATMTPADASLLEVGDDIRLEVGEDACIAIGSQVLSVDLVSATHTFESTRVASASVVQAACVVGSEPLVCDGTGDTVLDAPEWPIRELFAAYSVDRNGTRTALNITGARIFKSGGTIELTADVFPEGERNIELECRAGYEQPTTTNLGDWSAWSALERICLRAAEVFFMDDLNARGRQTDIAVGGMTARAPDYAMPADIESAIVQFVRTR